MERILERMATMRKVIISIIAEFEEEKRRHFLLYGRELSPKEFSKRMLNLGIKAFLDNRINEEQMCFLIKLYHVFCTCYGDPTEAEMLKYNLFHLDSDTAAAVVCVSRVGTIR
jgi:hypothetical protein